jgi:sigma54-dependent transcription regulator
MCRKSCPVQEALWMSLVIFVHHLERAEFLDTARSASLVEGLALAAMFPISPQAEAWLGKGTLRTSWQFNNQG